MTSEMIIGDGAAHRNASGLAGLRPEGLLQSLPSIEGPRGDGAPRFLKRCLPPPRGSVFGRASGATHVLAESARRMAPFIDRLPLRLGDRIGFRPPTEAGRPLRAPAAWPASKVAAARPSRSDA